MNKKGFTLMELLVVILIIGVVGVASTISFSSVDDQTAQTERANMYKDIQRSASLYLDLHSSDLQEFTKSGKVYIKLYKLMEENYISASTEDPVTGDKIDHTYSVVLYVNKEGENEYVDSCVVTYDLQCVAGADGKSNTCSAECK